MTTEASSAREDCPPVSRRWLEWFSRYSGWHVRRHFHSLRLSRSSSPPAAPGAPLVVFVNHASWWDPLVCLLAHRRLFPGRAGFAPIDAEGLAKYPLLAKLGMFGVERGTRRGAAQFLRVADGILASGRRALWITPEGRFTDPRERPVRFEAGLGHLAARHPRAVFQPMAIEYVFWHESAPEILARLGEPILAGESSLGAAQWTARLEGAMAATQERLAAESMARDPALFEPLLSGAGGVGGVYDAWRRAKALLRGRRFEAGHGKL